MTPSPTERLADEIERLETAFAKASGQAAINPVLTEMGRVMSRNLPLILSALRSRSKDVGEGEVEQLSNELASFCEAYPETIFPEPGKKDIEWLHNERRGLCDRIAAANARHCVKTFGWPALLLLRALAAEREALRGTLEEAFQAGAVFGRSSQTGIVAAAQRYVATLTTPTEAGVNTTEGG